MTTSYVAEVVAKAEDETAGAHRQEMDTAAAHREEMGTAAAHRQETGTTAARAAKTIIEAAVMSTAVPDTARHHQGSMLMTKTARDEDETAGALLGNTVTEEMGENETGLELLETEEAGAEKERLPRRSWAMTPIIVFRHRRRKQRPPAALWS